MLACKYRICTDDARFGFPEVLLGLHPGLAGTWRTFKLADPDKAMEMMLTGDAITGAEAARFGWANRAYPADELDARVLDHAERVAKIPSDMNHLNKRSVHRAMEIMGARAAMRAGTEIQSIGFHTRSTREYFKSFAKGVTHALNERDKAFGDYRTRERGDEGEGS